MSRLSAAIAEVEEQYDLSRDYRRFVDFMFDCLGLVGERLPDVSTSAIATAKSYFSGNASEEELEEARVKCWNYLEAHGHGSEIQDPEAIAIRASICALYAQPSTDDVVQLLGWFLSLINRLDDRSEEEVTLLQTHLPVSK